MKFSIIRAALAAIIVAALTPASVSAQDNSIPSTGVFKTSQQVYDLCKSTKKADLDICDWYLMAAFDMNVYYQDIEVVDRDVCAPMGMTALQLRKVVMDYWNSSPSSLKYSAPSTIMNALRGKYADACEK